MSSDSRLKLWQFWMFSLLWVSYGAIYLLRKPLGVIKNDLQVDLDVSEVNLGWIDIVFLFPYAIVSLTFAHVGDQLGPRITLSGGLIVAAMASVMIYKCHSFQSFLFVLFFNGVGQSLCFPAACSLLAKWFSPKSHNFIFGMFGTCFFAGGIISTMLAVYIQASFGWRMVFLILPLVVAFFGMLVYFAGYIPEEVGITVPGKKYHEFQTNEKVHIASYFWSIWKIRLVPEMSITIFCLKAVRYALLMWLPLYLLRTLEYSTVYAGLVSTFFEIGGLIGSAFVGVIVDKWMGGRALLVCTLGIGGSALTLILFMLTSQWGSLYHIIFLAITGALNGGPDILLVGSIAADIGDRAGGKATGVMSIVNGMGSLGTVFEGPMISLAVAWFGWLSVIPFMIFLSGIATLTSYRAHNLDTKYIESQITETAMP